MSVYYVYKIEPKNVGKIQEIYKKEKGENFSFKMESLEFNGYPEWDESLQEFIPTTFHVKCPVINGFVFKYSLAMDNFVLLGAKNDETDLFEDEKFASINIFIETKWVY